MQYQIDIEIAEQDLSSWVEAVEHGEEVLITRNGKRVARLVPVAGKRKLSEEQLAALERTRARMQKGYDLGGRMPSRDELHQR